MKLLIAADIFPPQSGGPATYSVTLANELSKQGIKVKIVSLNPESDHSKVTCPVYSVKPRHKIVRYIEYIKLLLQHSKDVDLIYAMGPVNAGLPAWIASAFRKKKLVVKVVGDYAWEQGQVTGVVKDSIDDFQKKNYGGKIGRLKKIEANVVRKADLVIAPCKYLKKMVEGWGANSEKIKVIYNEVDFIPVKPIEHPNEKWLVSVGRLVPWKGMNTLIEVISEISKQAPEWKLKIIGDGPEMSNLRRKVAEVNLEEVVQLTGNLPKKETRAFIAAADVFILNSAYEGLAHVIVEAMNQGVPVFASRAGGNSEMVAGDALFEYNNKEQIKEKILGRSLDGKTNSIAHTFGGFAHMIDETKKLLESL